MNTLKSQNPLKHQSCSLCSKITSSHIKVICSHILNPISLISLAIDPKPKEAILSNKIKKGACIYNPSAYHLAFRNDIVVWLNGISSKLKYNPTTYHRAIYLLDGLLSYFDVPDHSIKLATYIAIQLAAKLEENGTKIPCFRSVIELFNYEYTMEEVSGFEAHFLSAFDYYINRKTVYDELHEFLDRGVLFCSDFSAMDTSLTIQAKVSKFETLIKKLTDIYPLNYELYAFDPKLVSMTIISLARRYAGLTQWSFDLDVLKNTIIHHGKPIKLILEPFLLDNFESTLIEEVYVDRLNYKVDQSPRVSICDTEIEFCFETVSEDGSDSPRI